MTVSSIPPVIRYVSSGPGLYTFPFRIFKENQLTLTLTDASGLITLLVLGVDYTVTFNPEIDGGVCNLINVATSGTLEIRRVLEFVQETDWVNNDPLNVELLEKDLDRAVMRDQQLQINIEQGNQISSWRGDWVNNTPYYIGDNVTDPDTHNIYVCKVEHTSNSGGSITDDIALGYWALALDSSGLLQAEDNAIAAAQAAADSQAAAEVSANSAADDASAASADAASAKVDADRAEFFASTAVLNANVDPIGIITNWFGGYFTAPANANFRDVLGNTIAAANNYLNAFGYAVCDGTEFYDADSPIFNQPGRFLPNLVDERVIMGKNQAGEFGGFNTTQGSHTHATGEHTLTEEEMPRHNHSASSNSTGGHSHTITGTKATEEGGAQNTGPGIYMDYTFNTVTAGSHSHTITVNNKGGDGAHNHGFTDVAGSTNDNRPRYLAMFPIMKYKYAPHDENLNYFLVKTE